mmetsp:Transcript_64283/g.122627  ORF Transcript_64283/g.122627 Transcript_64283/m.122627 type:complete len:221 (-) Transcript_64283:699-1361(-)
MTPASSMRGSAGDFMSIPRRSLDTQSLGTHDVVPHVVQSKISQRPEQIGVQEFRTSATGHFVIGHLRNEVLMFLGIRYFEHHSLDLWMEESNVRCNLRHPVDSIFRASKATIPLVGCRKNHVRFMIARSCRVEASTAKTAPARRPKRCDVSDCRCAKCVQFLDRFGVLEQEGVLKQDIARACTCCIKRCNSTTQRMANRVYRRAPRQSCHERSPSRIFAE